MQTELAKQFHALWKSSISPPDVFAFLEQQSNSDTSDKLAVILTDQQHRWKTDTPLKVEEYFIRFPELGRDSEVVLYLLAGEIEARATSGSRPSDDWFASRVKEIGDVLRMTNSKVPGDIDSLLTPSFSPCPLGQFFR